ncbi:MAG: hypothetical protein DRJ26_04260 [Candidatus Methanomethylicota archaeon]|uniref:Uncharacterized protein n=1 Tax=Thermoproteota archaeon TaxID=2056631 RepID=A0A497F1H3_9CREN|nr:MAG: hypothetical protein DRJ26_04260 [Candidatus Verstraetearchaeota archaeon]
MSNLSELKKRFINLHEIYLEANRWAMAAFYSDSEVSKLNNILYERWAKEGMKGEPIDYASKEELLMLIRKIQAYAGVRADEVVRDLMIKGEISVSSRISALRGFFDKLISIIYRLFLPGSRK